MSETTAALGAEFSKLRSIRSTLITLLAFAPVTLLLAVLGGWSARGAIDSDNPALRSDFTPEQAGFDGILYGQLALVVFGVLAVTSEYSSGMMRVSLLAVPKRGRLYAAKMAMTAAAAAAVAVPVTVLSYLLTQSALGPHGSSLTADGVPAALAGSSAYLTLMCLFAAGIATAARNAVVPLIILVPMLLAGTHILSIIGATKEIVRYFPDKAGSELLTVGSGDTVFGLVVLAAWTVAALGAGYLRHRRWDG
ncbi:ABC transporter permease [Streptomyces sp. CA-278952]|uniref:ABC transporter permease n=1 Tax=unclassified Streptomyces TaxID=2593676 RepID=UPI002241ECCC|nr:MULTISPECIES: ABC transporter permease [unclassified Streptomyces]UZI32669.1 ABC transporter permease [Streptomyces sp. VB1]WDG32600.1 ABC transporter permease [Streptomyces sp. CA-278952]